MAGSLGNECQPVHYAVPIGSQGSSGGAQVFRCLLVIFAPQQVLEIGIGSVGHVMEAVAATELHDQIRSLKGGHREMFPEMSGRDGHSSCARAAEGGSRLANCGHADPAEE